MTGLIWFVQVVHYPLFAAVPPEAFEKYERDHQSLTTLVVGPAMLLEAASAFFLFFHADFPSNAKTLFGVSLALLALVWLSTALLQMPYHTVLSSGYSLETIKKLVNTNWIRTFAWTLRFLIVILIAVQLSNGAQ